MIGICERFAALGLRLLETRFDQGLLGKLAPPESLHDDAVPFKGDT